VPPWSETRLRASLANRSEAKGGELIGYATKIRKRAERRLGELMGVIRAAGEMAKPPGGSKARPKKDRVASGPDPSATLKDQGIDKHLADRARKSAAMSEASGSDGGPTILWRR
jgi:hypothetical protein